MDKSYLIHNIKFADSAANGHQTFDIELKNLKKEPTDLTADVTITHNTAGSAPETMNFEGVSLIGAGSSGSSDFSTAIVTFNILGRDPDGGGGWDNIVSIINDNLIVVPDFSNFELHGNSTEIVLYKGHAIGTASGMDFAVSGSATLDENTGEIDITGDCTISYTAADLS